MGLNEDLGDRENIGNHSLTVAREREKREKREAIKPSEVWSPSQGGKPMPIGRPDSIPFHSGDVIYGPFRWASENNRYWDGQGVHYYPRNPMDCAHTRKRMIPPGPWICSDCGSQV